MERKQRTSGNFDIRLSSLGVLDWILSDIFLVRCFYFDRRTGIVDNRQLGGELRSVIYRI